MKNTGGWWVVLILEKHWWGGWWLVDGGWSLGGWWLIGWVITMKTIIQFESIIAPSFFNYLNYPFPPPPSHPYCSPSQPLPSWRCCPCWRHCPRWRRCGGDKLWWEVSDGCSFFDDYGDSFFDVELFFHKQHFVLLL